MSSEIDRLRRSSRRETLFWLFVTVVLLAYCLFGAFANDPMLIHSWRGAALLLVSTGFLAWYATWAISHCVRKDQPIIGARRLPWRTALLRWGYVFITLCAMTVFSPMMGWMFWAPFGMALGMFEFPLLLLPAGLSALGIFYALIVTNDPPSQAVLWIVISMGLGLLSVGYTIYTSKRLTG